MLGALREVDPPSAADRRLERVSFGALVTLGTLPLLLGTTFANPDIARHHAFQRIAWSLLSDPAGATSRVFELQHDPAPSVAWYALLAPMLLLPPDLAERLMALLHVVGLPLATRWSIRRLAPAAGTMAWLGLPLVWTLLLGFGLLNFLFGVALCTLALAAAVRADDRHGRSAVAALFGGLLLLGTHPLVYDVTVALVGGVLAWRLALEPDRRAGLRRLVFVGLGLLPSGVTAVWFVLHAGDGDAPLWTSSILERAYWLATGDFLVTYGLLELAAALATVCLWSSVLGLAALARRGSPWQASDGLIATAALALAFYFTVPDEIAGGTLVARRSQVFVWLPLILWAASQPVTPSVRQAATAIVALVFAAQVGAHAWTQRLLSADFDEIFDVVDPIGPGDTLLVLGAAPMGVDPSGSARPGRVAPLDSASSVVASRTGAVDLSNWLAAYNAFPVRYRDATPDRTHLGLPAHDVERYPPPVRLDAYREQTGEPIDHVLVFGVTPANQADPDVRRLTEQLDQGWTLVRTSRPRGLARLYEPARP